MKFPSPNSCLFNSLLVLITLSSCLLSLQTLAATKSTQQYTGPYVRGGVGGSIIEDSSLDDFLGMANGETLSFETGLAANVGIGYNLNRWLAAEFETGFNAHHIDRLGNVRYGGDAGLYQTPLLINVIAQYRNKAGLVPFIGAGAGGSLQIFLADNLRTPNLYLDGTASDLVFAWQGFAGIKFEFNQHMGIGITYRYREIEPASWDISGFFDDTAISFGKLKNHSLTADFYYQF
jgi:opacity protein-like surface antigen